MTTGNTGNNRKKVLIVGRMPQAGIDVLKKRDDVDYEILTDDSVPSLHPKLKDANAVTLGGTAFRQAELDAAPHDEKTLAHLMNVHVMIMTCSRFAINGSQR